MQSFNFTKSETQKLPTPNKAINYYKDTKEKGLSLYVTPKGHKTFYVRKRINGKDERINIGSFPETTIENARKEALKIKSMVAQGNNPNYEKRRLKSETTFKELFNQFMEFYSKKEKRSWKYDEREVNKFLSHIFNRKISSITTSEVKKIHDNIRINHGLYQANRVLERTRTIFNKAIEWGWEGYNPTNGIKKFKEYKRDRFIQPEELSKFFRALEKESNITARDYILISLFTGARKRNVLSMRWNEIDWYREIWKIPESKNGEAIVIPLIPQAITILKWRYNETNTDWVFPSGTSITGHFTDPKKAWKRILSRAGIKDLRIHDIRRTLGSYQAITGASLSIIGKSLGHKSPEATQIYARLHNDPVRNSISSAVNEMMKFNTNSKEYDK